jgi:hypothetical protein
MRMRDVLVAAAVLASGPASAGTLVGKIELPSNLPVRPKPAEPGFVERYENPVTPVRPLNVTQRMVIVVEGDEKPAAPPRVQWNLVGESFGHPVIAAAAGAEVTIVNQSKTERTQDAAPERGRQGLHDRRQGCAVPRRPARRRQHAVHRVSRRVGPLRDREHSARQLQAEDLVRHRLDQSPRRRRQHLGEGQDRHQPQARRRRIRGQRPQEVS